MTTDQAARDAGLLPAGPERGKPCWCCGDPIGEHYVLAGQIPQVPGVGAGDVPRVRGAGGVRPVSRLACWLMLGHRRTVVGARNVRVESEGVGEWDATDVLYRCTRCSHVFSRRVKGPWSTEQVVAS